MGIKFTDVIDLDTDTREVLVRRPSYARIKLSAKDFSIFRFEAVKWIKTKEKPEDRIWQFETIGPLGVWSFEKEQKLIESRMTREERRAEKMAYENIKRLLKERGLE